jgi:hypothetical protein
MTLSQIALWGMIGVLLFGAGCMTTLAVVWKPTTVVVADGGLDIRIYNRRLTPAEQRVLIQTFTQAPRERVSLEQEKTEKR